MNHQYKEADTYFVLNDRDDNLRPIYISLPKPPPLELIAGYGLPPEEQKFKRLVYPKRLKALEDEVFRNLKKDESRDVKVNGYNLYKEFWRKIESEYKYYKEEIEWIRNVWWHRINGYWFFNNGVPTYITGWHFTYLNFYYLDEAGQYPDYRDRDRRWFLGVKYAYESTETFADLDKDGNAVKVDGMYRMVDTGNKMFYGTVNSKGRRIGDTSKAGVPYLEIGATTFGGLCGIISFGGDSSEGIFKKKIIPAWQKMPVWMKPMFANNNNPSSIQYNPPSNVFGEEGLSTVLDFASSASDKSYDSKRLSFILMDEEGKVSRADVNSRWESVKQCLTEGDDVVGFSIHPTTVEEMEEGGGKEFFTMMKNANFYHRMHDTGRTKNGLLSLFFRASDGRKGAIDKYGMSVEFEVSESQKKEGFVEGAFYRLEKQRQQLIRSGTPDDLKLHRELQRKYPIYFMDSFVDEAGGMGFDYVIIGRAIERLKTHSKARRYNIITHPNDPDGVRMLVPDEEGRFLVSIDLPPSRTNQRIKTLEYNHITGMDEWVWRPKDMTTFTAGADPVTYFGRRDVRSGSAISKAGGCVFWNYDPQLDKSEKPEEWESYRFVVTYLHQPRTDDEYAEDMLNMCVYFGAMMYSENNKDLIIKHFDKRGYAGYLLYDIDEKGRRKAKSGVWLQGGVIQKGFSLMASYIKLRGNKDEHLDLMEQCDSIKTVDQLTKHDLLSACICALLGTKSEYGEVMKRIDNTTVDLGKLEAMF